MKKHILSYIFVFISILFITNRVFAESVSYGYRTCGSETRWNAENKCLDSGVYKNAFTINYSGDNIDVTFMADAFPDFADYANLSSTENVFTYKKETTTFHYDFTSVEEYYKTTKKVPENIVVAFAKDQETRDVSSSLGIAGVALTTFYDRYYYFGVSELETVTKAGEHEQHDDYYYFSNNQELNNVNSCLDLDHYIHQMEEYAKLYGAEGDKTVAYSEEVNNKCVKYLKYATHRSNSCYSQCRDIKQITSDIGVDIFNETNECGLGSRMTAWLVRFFKLLRYLVPILVIVLSTFEYVNAIMSADDDAMKKVGGRFGKRLFIMILFLAIPSLLQFVFNIFNIDGLSSSNPYCLK